MKRMLVAAPLVLAACLLTPPASAQTTIPNEAGHLGGAAYFKGKVFYSWAGTDGNQTPNIASLSGDKATLWGESAHPPQYAEADTVVLGTFNGKLYSAWTDANCRINMISSADGTNFGDKRVLSERTQVGVSLASSNRYLYLAWSGMDDRLNIMRSSNGLDWSKSNKTVLSDTSELGPSLTYAGGRLYLVWTENVYWSTTTNSLESTDDGVTWSNRQSYSTPYPVRSPTAYYTDSLYFMYGKSCDSGTCSNYCIMNQGPSMAFGQPSVVLNGCTSGNGGWISTSPAVVYTGDSIYVFYTRNINETDTLEYYQTTPGVLN